MLLYSRCANERVPNVTVIPDYPEKFKRWQNPCLCSLSQQDEREVCGRERKLGKEKKEMQRCEEYTNEEKNITLHMPYILWDLKSEATFINVGCFCNL